MCHNVYMTLLQRIVGTAATLFLLGAMLTQPTPNDLDLDLPMAIQGVEEPPVVMRIGIVADIVEADNITVRISGSPVLVQASYLFPIYQPVLGDRVVVHRQDGQWFVLGTMSGPINSVVPNPSFELGVVGSTPTSWTLNIISNAAGNPTFTKVPGGQGSVSGQFVADFGIDSVPGGFSEADVFSSTVAAAEGEQWTCAYFLTGAFVDTDSVFLSSNGEPSFLDFHLQFLDSGGVIISDTVMNSIAINTDVVGRQYRRPLLGAQSVTAPPNTTAVRVKFAADFFMTANSFTSFFIDDVILRRVT